MKPRVLGSLLVVAMAAVGGYAYWSGSLPGLDGGRAAGEAAAAKPRGKPPVPVITTRAAIASVPERFSTIGTAQPLATVAIKARVESVVETVHFTEGQEVRAGDPLFTLDDRQLRAQLALAEANLERDAAQLEKARGDVRRYTELVRRDAVARQQFEAATAAAAALEATVKADEAAIDSARVALSHTRINAPMDGRTGIVSAKPGASVRPADATPLVTLTQLRPIVVAFFVPERRLSAIRAAMASGPVTVRAAVPDARGALPDTGDAGAKSTDAAVEEGSLVFIDSQVDPQSGTILARAEFPNRATRLWPGQFVDVTITLRVDTDALVVPEAAVLTGQDGRFIYVVGADETAQPKPVTVARTDGGLAVITQGLSEGETVVVDGQSRLVPGAKVAERDGGGKGAPPAGGRTGS